MASFLYTAPLSDFCSTRRLSTATITDETSISVWNHHVGVCRKFILTHDEVAAFPVPRLSSEKPRLLIISPEHFLEREDVSMTMSSLGIRVEEEAERPNEHSVQCCIEFSIMTKLEGLWYKMGNHFIEGQNFFVPSPKTCGLAIDVSFCSDELILNIKPVRCVYRLLKLEDLVSSSTALDKFKSSEDSILYDFSLDVIWSLVLPNLTKGRIYCISRRPDSECAATNKYSRFKTHKQLADHWKTMYGYELPPSNGDDTVYAFVYFGSSEMFCYPLHCLLESQPRIGPLPRDQQQRIADAFMTDLAMRLPSIVGKPLAFEPVQSGMIKPALTVASAREKSHEERKESSRKRAFDLSPEPEQSVSSSSKRNEVAAKPRNQPDVEQFIREHNWNALTRKSLICWLEKRGVRAKPNAKKAELIVLAMTAQTEE
ncbi:uncharacterized protein C18orf63-like isoform X2 [Oscarella lobularis]|uniref:uncharacterized protein C18orf63-like isoform X2 n=1 Tax=Oscarella lobularis TaxID=121494 RepID=UPI003314020E